MLNDAEITAKSVEVGKCLLNTQAGLVKYDLETTLRVADAARLAVSIKNVREKISKEAIAGITSALKIDFRIANAEILPLFESLGWARLDHKGKHIVSVTEQIPPTEDVLSVLGKIWREQEPTPVDQATVNALNLLSKRPYSKEALVSELDVKDEEFQVALEYGEGGRYLGKFRTDDEKLDAIWTPLYWMSNSQKVLAFLEKQNSGQYEKIGKLAATLKQQPGVPRETIQSGNGALLDSGIYHGFFPAVVVTDRHQKAYQYVFAAAPQFETGSHTDIFEKARLIVSCVRHGQYHAEVTRILYPRKLLAALRTNSMKPHPYADVQYALLVLHGIVKLKLDSNRYGKAFRVEWIDTPENNLAADIADQLLAGEEAYVKTKEELDAQKIMVQGLYSYSSEQRRIKVSETVVAKKEWDRVMELVTGVKV
jgi:hypothetical protein